MLYYYIQSHGSSIDQLRWLINSLDHPGNEISASHDGEIILGDDIPQTNDAKLSFLQSGKITYLGYSQVLALLESIRLALESSQSWTYFINLSAACVPLKSQNYIHEYFKQAQLQGILGYFFGFKVLREAPNIKLTNFSDVTYSKVNIKRPDIYCERSALWLFEKGEFNPINNPATRANLNSVDILGSRTLYVRPLLTNEIHERALFFSHHPHYCGRAWYVLHRSLCDCIIKDFYSSSPWEYTFQNIIVADESVLNSWIRSHKDFAEKCKLDDNLRFLMGAPAILADTDLPEIVSSTALFARKVNLKTTPNIKEYLTRNGIQNVNG